jgi:para-nitrobenzyl esterase
MNKNLSRKGDVVFIFINHRLGSIGFSDLSEVGGSKYTDSGNVGCPVVVYAYRKPQCARVTEVAG